MSITDTISFEASGAIDERVPSEGQPPEAAENRARAWLSRRLAWEDRFDALHDEG